jgi:streptomycin 6-kinase
VNVPSGLEWWRDVPAGAAWLLRLPSIAARCAEQWSLRLGDPFEPAHISLVVPVEGADGQSAIRRSTFRSPRASRRATRSATGAGRGAIRLLAEDKSERALLVERCRPGVQLWSVEDDTEATRIGATVLERLWRPAPAEDGFRLLAQEAARWARELPDAWTLLQRPFERRLVDEAVSACSELGLRQGEQVVLHQDFHGGNVLRAEREPWLAIDPKRLVGEREFGAASLLRDRRWLLGRDGNARRIRRRLDLLASELGLDRERMRRWGIAHALAWGMSGRKVEEDMIGCARLLAAAA